MKTTFLIGRILFGGYFVHAGINHFLQTKNVAQYAGAKGVPMPDVAVQATGALMVTGGMSIVLGLKPKYGAAAIVAFLAAVSPWIHDFWQHEDPQRRQAEMVNFTKNLAMLGAALALAGVEEPWSASIRAARPSVIDRVTETARRLLAA
jgi:putative oxidoreductase